MCDRYFRFLECQKFKTSWVLFVIPCSGTLADRPPSLLPCLIDGRCQPLFSPESKSSYTDQVLLDEDSTGAARRRYLRVRTRDHQQSRAMASCTLLFPLALLIFFLSPL